MTGWTHWRGSSHQKLQNVMDPEGEKACGMNWEIGIDICTLLILCIAQVTNQNLQGTQLRALC